MALKISMKQTSAAVLLAGLILPAVVAFAQTPPAPSSGNPIAPHIFAADPSAHVWPGDPDTLWLYTSHDEPGTNNHDTMADYHVFSTKDLMSWTDHGQVFSLNSVPWAASHAWAIDAVLWKGKYYLIHCMKHKTTGVFMTGVAVSERPEGPFKDLGYVAGTEWGQDPAVFVDDDGKAYLYWGHDYLLYAAQLTDDLMAIVPETKVELTKQLDSVFEGPWMNKINGKYYLSYPGMPGRKWPQALYYASSDAPLGPFKSLGQYLPRFGLQSGTNHGSVINFKGQWIAFYHSAWGAMGNGTTRSLMADFMTINADGTWNKVVPSTQGLVPVGKKATSRIWLEAENGEASGGQLIATRVETKTAGFGGAGYVTGFPVQPGHDQAFYAIEKECPSCPKRASVGSVTVLAQVAYDQKYQLKVRYSADQKTRLWVLVGSQVIKGNARNPNEVWADASPDKFEMFDLGVVSLKAGDNKIKLHTRDNLDVRIDAFELTPIYD